MSRRRRWWGVCTSARGAWAFSRARSLGNPTDCKEPTPRVYQVVRALRCSACQGRAVLILTRAGAAPGGNDGGRRASAGDDDHPAGCTARRPAGAAYTGSSQRTKYTGPDPARPTTGRDLCGDNWWRRGSPPRRGGEHGRQRGLRKRTAGHRDAPGRVDRRSPFVLANQVYCLQPPGPRGRVDALRRSVQRDHRRCCGKESGGRRGHIARGPSGGWHRKSVLRGALGPAGGLGQAAGAAARGHDPERESSL